jgi:type IV secretion system protein VirB9
MKHLLIALTIATSLTGPAWALDTPQAGRVDQNVRREAYNPENRTRLIGEMKRSTTITFAPTEKILRVAFGDETSWDGPDSKAPTRNNLTLWPVKPGTTNMQVTTLLPDGSERLYQFALVTRSEPADGSDDPDATFGLIFTYPTDVQVASAAVAKKAAEDNEARTSRNRLEADVFYGMRNWRYTAKGDRGIAPTEVSDNGRLTAFRFPGNTKIPAIYIVGPDSTEQIAPFVMKDDLVVVQDTAREFHVRQGTSVLYIYNRAFDPVGPDPRTGTTSTDVIRQLREAAP